MFLILSHTSKQNSHFTIQFHFSASWMTISCQYFLILSTMVPTILLKIVSTFLYRGVSLLYKCLHAALYYWWQYAIPAVTPPDLEVLTLQLDSQPLEQKGMQLLAQQAPRLRLSVIKS